MIRATGRLVHHDPASRAYAAAPVPLIERSWLHTMGPVLDQGGVNGCTGWTAADLLNSPVALANRRRYNTATFRSVRAYLGNDDGRAIYERATRNDSFGWTFPPTDNGSSGLGAVKALKQLGVIDVYRWTFDFQTMLAWAQRQPVMLGLLWTPAMSDPDAKGIIHIGSPAELKRADDAGMGHEVSLRGVNWPRKLARIRNHWTADWGIGGDALISLADLETLIMGWRGDVCVPEVSAK